MRPLFACGLNLGPIKSIYPQESNMPLYVFDPRRAKSNAINCKTAPSHDDPRESRKYVIQVQVTFLNNYQLGFLHWLCVGFVLWASFIRPCNILFPPFRRHPVVNGIWGESRFSNKIVFFLNSSNTKEDSQRLIERNEIMIEFTILL